MHSQTSRFSTAPRLKMLMLLLTPPWLQRFCRSFMSVRIAAMTLVSDNNTELRPIVLTYVAAIWTSAECSIEFVGNYMTWGCRDSVDSVLFDCFLSWVGNERDASCSKTLEELGITHILNVTAHIPFHFEDRLACKRLQASDSGSQNLKQYFEEAIHFIGMISYGVHIKIKKSRWRELASFKNTFQGILFRLYKIVIWRPDI